MSDVPARADSGGRLLVVDDEDAARRLLTRILTRSGYDVAEAPGAPEALRMLGAGAFDLVLTDMNMPGPNGLELIERINASAPDVATIMVTAIDDTALADVALDSGAYGYVVKPLKPNEVLINVSNALRRRSLELENLAHREHLEQMVKERTAELWRAVQELEQARDDLRSAQAETIERLSKAAEFRDDQTGAHIRRMSRYCALLAEARGMDPVEVENVRLASVMHDVGKIGVPDSILLKPGKLTSDEFETMKQHAEFGHRILTGSGSDLLELAATVAATHHERYDGGGYPRGLAGEDIPLPGRIAAIADAFDAITTNRVYRRAYSLAEAIEMMRAERARQFDPALLDLFFDRLDEVIRIHGSAV